MLVLYQTCCMLAIVNLLLKVLYLIGFGHQGQLYVTKSQKGTYIVGLVCSDRILVYQMVLYLTNSNNYSFGNHFFKVLVQIHYSHLKQLVYQVL